MEMEEKLKLNMWQQENPIRKWRESKGISVVELSEKLDVHKNTIRSWEYATSFPLYAQLDKLIELSGDKNLATKLHQWKKVKPE